MKTLLALLSLFFTGLVPVDGAITVSDITKAQFDSLISTYQASFSVVFRGGADSGSNSEELRLATNTATPQAGGGSNTSIANLPGPSPRWSQPITDIQVTLDSSSNINARAASVTLDRPVTRLTNQVLVLTADSQILGRVSELKSNVFEGVSIRDLFADGNGTYQFDVVSVTGIGATFDYSANWAPSDIPSSDIQYVWIVGINNTSIPEPSSLILVCTTGLFLLARRR